MADLKVGDRVRDAHGRDGIVVRLEHGAVGVLNGDETSWWFVNCNLELVERAHYAPPDVTMIAMTSEDTLRLRALLGYANGHPDFYLRGDLEDYVREIIAQVRRG